MTDAAFDSDGGFGYRARAPFWFGCLFLMSLSFPGLGELPGGISMALVFMLACLPIWYSAACAREGPVLDETSRKAVAIILSCVAFLILWSLVSVLGSAYPVRAGRYVATLVAAFAIYFLVVGTLTTDRLRVYLDVLCFALAFTCLMSLMAYFEPRLHAMIFQDSDRAFGFFKNPNQFGMAISTVLPVALAVFLGRRRGRLARLPGPPAVRAGRMRVEGEPSDLVADLGIHALFLFDRAAGAARRRRT